MTTLALDFPTNRTPRILFIGAHSDDIEIGVGGTVLSLSRKYPSAEITWCVLSGSGERADEARAAAELFLGPNANPNILLPGFRDGFFPEQWSEIKTFFEKSLKPSQPDLIFCHQQNDKHQDHKVAANLVWNTFRSHLILGYEIPKFDGDLGHPNVFVELSLDDAEKKVSYLQRAFASQRSKHWFREDLFHGLMAIRAMECGSLTGRAEAFYARKVKLDLAD